MPTSRRLVTYCFGVSLLLATAGAAQDPWAPHARYREYVWTTPDTGEAFLRVGGRYGYVRTPGRFAPDLREGGELILPGDVELRRAVAATVTLEKVLSHEDSRDLRIAINGHAPIAVPEPAAVPAPQTDYMYHTDVEVSVPLAQLREGRDNRFALSVDTAQRWGWPQNVFYAVIFRVYYAPSEGDSPGVDYALAQVPLVSELRVAGARPDDEVADYVFVGRDVDWSGRGLTDRKHFQTYRAEPHHTLGRSRDAGAAFAKTWDASWLPEQPAGRSIGVQARVRGSDGVWRVGPVRTGLTLAPRARPVHLLESGPAPANWVTRADTFSQTFAQPLPAGDVTAYRLHWTSWSPCYANGLYLNDHLLWIRGGDCYAYATHEPVFDAPHDLHAIEAGTNVLRTGKTPLVRGGMVHGMEVQWPGVWVKVRAAGE